MAEGHQRLLQRVAVGVWLRADGLDFGLAEGGGRVVDGVARAVAAPARGGSSMRARRAPRIPGVGGSVAIRQ